VVGAAGDKFVAEGFADFAVEEEEDAFFCAARRQRCGGCFLDWWIDVSGRAWGRKHRSACLWDCRCPGEARVREVHGGKVNEGEFRASGFEPFSKRLTQDS